MADESSSAEAGEPPAQNTELVNQVFTLFKGYLSSQLDAQGKIIHSKSKTDKDAAGLKYKGNRKQFELNAHLDEILDNIDREASNASRVHELVADAKQLIKRRQKFIRIADKSKDGWAVVDEYESDDLASDSADEKRLKKAKNAVEKKRKSSKATASEPKRFKSSFGDNQLFRGKACTANIYRVSFLCVNSQGVDMPERIPPTCHYCLVFSLERVK